MSPAKTLLILTVVCNYVITKSYCSVSDERAEALSPQPQGVEDGARWGDMAGWRSRHFNRFVPQTWHHSRQFVLSNMPPRDTLVTHVPSPAWSSHSGVVWSFQPAANSQPQMWSHVGGQIVSWNPVAVGPQKLELEKERPVAGRRYPGMNHFQQPCCIIRIQPCY